MVSSRWCICAGLVGLVACASPQKPYRPHFRAEKPATVVNDRVHTPEGLVATTAKGLVGALVTTYERPIHDALALRVAKPSQVVNALGEVPDSTWFRNRIGSYELSADDVLRGPGGAGPADGDWMIVGTKVGGAAVGIEIRDRSGARYLLKFGAKDLPEAETAAAAIAQRIYWAFGFNVPEDNVVIFDRKRLCRDRSAEITNRDGSDRPMTDEDVERILEMIRPLPDGRLRALASRMIEGEPLGGYAGTGTRRGDPNDLVPHQRRRDLRGERLLAMWLAHTDIKSHNTLDALVSDPQDEVRRNVLHYHIDFGKALGVFGVEDRRQQFFYILDLEEIAKSMLSFGLWRRGWEAVESTGLRGVGFIDAKTLDPRNWRPSHFWPPFSEAGPLDEYWAAKIILRFRPEHIRAAIAAGRLSDPRSERYLLGVLLARQRRVGRYALSRVTPVDSFRVADGTQLCFRDLWVVHRFGRAESRRYTAMGAEDRQSRPVERRGDELCTPLADRASDAVIIRVFDRARDLRPVVVEVAEVEGQPTIVGVLRDR